MADQGKKRRRIRIPKLDVKGFFALVIQAGKAWNDHRAPRMGAALSYYTAFSLGPLVVLILSIASLLVQERDKKNLSPEKHESAEVLKDQIAHPPADDSKDDHALQEKDKTYSIFGIRIQHGPGFYIVGEVNALMGSNGGDAVKEILKHSGSVPAASWSTAISFIFLLIGASGAFGELQDSLNQIWDVPPQKNPFLTMIKERALSFAMVFVLGFFMLVSLVLSALIAAVSHAVVAQFPAIGLEVANTLISFVIFSGLFCVIFRLLPDVEIHWSDVWPGAVFSSALFILGKFLLGWYIGLSSTSFSRYGAAGSFIVILVWVFYSAQILFMGAEFSRAYTLKYGSHRNTKATDKTSSATA